MYKKCGVSLMIENYIISENYFLNETEESNHINDINNLLKNLENILKLNSSEMNQIKIIESSLISESMLKLLLKKQSCHFRSNTPFNILVDYATIKKIIPNECNKFLQIIIKYRNETIKGINTSDKLTSSFLKAFMLFISWFDDYYSEFKVKKEFEIKNCCLIIKSLLNEDTEQKFNSLDSAVKARQVNFNTCQKCGYTLEEDDNYCPNCGIKLEHKSYISNAKIDMILELLDQQSESLIQVLQTVLETNNIVKGIDEKINLITYRLNQIQSQTEKLINNAWSSEEIDRIIQVHTTECVESILEYENDIINDQNYEYVRDSLVETFGNTTWRKLSEKSKTFLITSKIMFNKLLNLGEVIDYSGICILVTKALEVEIYKRFFTNFIKYLDEKYNKDYSQYPTALLFKNSKPLRPEKFTMGNIAFVLCPEKNWNDSNEQKENNKVKLMEYCKNCVFSKYDEKEIENMLKRYASAIEEIKEKYRNPSAHRNQIACVDAKECIDLIIDIEKLLKKMLDSFDK